MGDRTPTGNLLLRENHDDGKEERHRNSRNVMRGKGVGSKDVIARQLQRGIICIYKLDQTHIRMGGSEFQSRALDFSCLVFYTAL